MWPQIISVDNEWFGNRLPLTGSIEHHKIDIRSLDPVLMKNVDSVIHLANIANDPSVI